MLPLSLIAVHAASFQCLALESMISERFWTMTGVILVVIWTAQLRTENALRCLE